MQVGARTIVRSTGRDPYYIYIYVYVYIYIHTCCTHGAVGSCYIIQQYSYKTAVPVIIQAGFVLQDVLDTIETELSYGNLSAYNRLYVVGKPGNEVLAPGRPAPYRVA
jgi:hypothetical protein